MKTVVGTRSPCTASMVAWNNSGYGAIRITATKIFD